MTMISISLLLIAFLQPIHAQSISIDKKNATLIVNSTTHEFGYEGGPVAFNHDNAMFIYPITLKNPKFGNWTVQLWSHYMNNDTSKFIDLNGSLNRIADLRLSPDDKKLLFVGSSCDNNQSHTTFYIIDLQNPYLQCNKLSNVASADWMPDGSIVLAQNNEKNDTVMLYQNNTEKLLYLKQITPPDISLNSSHIEFIKASPDGKKIALWYFVFLSHKTQILNVDDGKIIDTFDGGHPRWSHDGKMLLYTLPIGTGYYTNGPRKVITYVNLLDIDNNKTTNIDTVSIGINDLSLSADSKSVFYMIQASRPYAFLNFTSGIYKIELNHDTDTHIETPLQQFESGIPASEVVCKEGFQLILKKEDGSPACINSENVTILVSQRGWGLAIN